MGYFGKWWFGVEETIVEYIDQTNTVRTVTDTFPVIVDPATNRYPITGTTYTEVNGNGNKEVCKVDGEAQRAFNYAGTTHVCIGESTSEDYNTYSDERPYLFFYNEKTNEFLYQLVCDGIGEEGRLPMIKMVNNGGVASDKYVNYPVDITKYKKVSQLGKIFRIHHLSRNIFSHI